MAMEIPVGADIHHNFKPKVCVFKCPANLLPAGGALCQIRFEKLSPGLLRKRSCLPHSVVPACVVLLKDNPGRNFCLRFRVELNEANLRTGKSLQSRISKEFADAFIPAAQILLIVRGFFIGQTKQERRYFFVEFGLDLPRKPPEFPEWMGRGSVDEIFESLGIPAERHLADGSHRQKSTKSIESLLFQNGFFLVVVDFQPLLQTWKQGNVCVEQMIHCCRVICQKAMAQEIRLRNVVKISAADLRSEIDVAC